MRSKRKPVAMPLDRYVITAPPEVPDFVELIQVEKRTSAGRLWHGTSVAPYVKTFTGDFAGWERAHRAD